MGIPPYPVWTCILRVHEEEVQLPSIDQRVGPCCHLRTSTGRTAYPFQVLRRLPDLNHLWSTHRRLFSPRYLSHWSFWLISICLLSFASVEWNDKCSTVQTYVPCVSLYLVSSCSITSRCKYPFHYTELLCRQRHLLKWCNTWGYAHYMGSSRIQQLNVRMYRHEKSNEEQFYGAWWPPSVQSNLLFLSIFTHWSSAIQYFSTEYSELLPGTKQTVALRFIGSPVLICSSVHLYDTGVARITQGWDQFLKEHHIQQGDVLVFRCVRGPTVWEMLVCRA